MIRQTADPVSSYPKYIKYRKYIQMSYAQSFLLRLLQVLVLGHLVLHFMIRRLACSMLYQMQL